MKVVVVCIAKDEDNYVEEWLSYHHKLGVDEIVMYENDWSCPIDKPFLKKIKWDGKHQQMPAYNNFLENFREEYDWILFLDVDEFLVLKKHNNIKDFLIENDNPNGIALNWMWFGSCNRKERGEHQNSLLKQFTLRNKDVDNHIKTILKSSSGGKMVLPHNPNIHLFDTNRKKVMGPFNQGGPIDQAQVNHYHYKTYEDWLIRCNRGQSDHTPNRKPHQWDECIGLSCDVEDLTALNFMYPNENQ